MPLLDTLSCAWVKCLLLKKEIDHDCRIGLYHLSPTVHGQHSLKS